MEVARVVERVERIASLRAAPAVEADLLKTGLVAVREVRAWCDAQQAGLVRSLGAVDSFAEKAVAVAAKQSLGQAAKSTGRAEELGSTPTLADALEDGAITAEHVDVVTRVSRKLEGAKRVELIRRADRLAAVATAGTVDEFARRLDLEAKKLQQDDGLDRLARQRRNARAKSWVDLEGKWSLSLKLDPVSEMRVAARIDAMVQSLFAEVVPDECPTHPIEEQQYLAAQAVARLLLDEALGNADTPGDAPDAQAPNSASASPSSPSRPRPGAPEFVAVIDADAPGHHGPVAEFSIPVEIPARVLAALAGDADVHGVMVRNGIVLHAPGELYLGRTSRLANRAQRRALRGLYRECAIPGCTVGYDRCRLHHIIWWSQGGRTDLDNLLPVCSVHHTNTHHDGWVIELGTHRELTLRLPDGNVHITGPPGRSRRSTAA